MSGRSRVELCYTLARAGREATMEETPTPTPFANAVAGYILGIIRPAGIAVVPLVPSRLDDELLDQLARSILDTFRAMAERQAESDRMLTELFARAGRDRHR